MKKTGFTLVELVITITILVILSTIAFVSFQSYTQDSRDANRLATLNQLSNGLKLSFSKNGVYPTPESPVSLLASGTIIGYQGTIGGTLSSEIGLQSEAKDPLDKKYYTYRTDTSGEKYQILALLENQDNTLAYFQNVFAGYEKRSLKGLGDSLGILLDTSNTPIQELALTGVDIVTTNTSYKAFIKGSSSVSGTGYVLSYLKDGAGVSCNDILAKDKNKQNKDGVYLINPTGTGSFQVYCDMTTDGGGWTLIVKLSEAGLLPVSSFGGIGLNNYNEKSIFNIALTGANTSGWMNLNDIYIPNNGAAIAKCIANDNTFMGIKFDKYQKKFGYGLLQEANLLSSFYANSIDTWTQSAIEPPTLSITSIDGRNNIFYVGHDYYDHHLCKYDFANGGEITFGEIKNSSLYNKILGINGKNTESFTNLPSERYKGAQMIQLFIK